MVSRLTNESDEPESISASTRWKAMCAPTTSSGGFDTVADPNSVFATRAEMTGYEAVRALTSGFDSSFPPAEGNDGSLSRLPRVPRNDNNVEFAALDIGAIYALAGDNSSTCCQPPAV
ncbi:uncharacterized protein LOC143218528 isoform X1 [Lasioglossum baleicum]|uniref:uncharacterized protein LOC143218528 isoform X1 n=1 Tax=Lasioglossum baleicum TaxID=434251 RepID=UPI003FCDB814